MNLCGLSSERTDDFAVIDSFFNDKIYAVQGKMQLLHLRERLCQRDGELVGAGRILEAAADAAYPRDRVLSLHALDETGDALKIAVAAADDLDALDGVVVVQLDVHLLGTDALGAVVIDHFDISLS